MTNRQNIFRQIFEESVSVKILHYTVTITIIILVTALLEIIDLLLLLLDIIAQVILFS